MAVNMPVPGAHPLFTAYVSSLLTAPRRLQPTILGHVFKQIRKLPHNLQY
jgi:hypothetical protein